MKCPVCEAAELVHDIRNLPYTYDGEATTIPAVVGDYCPACGEGVFDAPESRRVSAAMLAFCRSEPVGVRSVDGQAGRGAIIPRKAH
jgi:HTH-type transcriptional regulator / antitoxin MqsA